MRSRCDGDHKNALLRRSWAPSCPSRSEVGVRLAKIIDENLGSGRARQQFRDPSVALGFTALKPSYAGPASGRPAAWAGRPASLPTVVSVEVVDAGGDVDAVPPNISCVGRRGRGQQPGRRNRRDRKFSAWGGPTFGV